jgi:hypothetical protein
MTLLEDKQTPIAATAMDCLHLHLTVEFILEWSLQPDAFIHTSVPTVIILH